MVFSSIEFVDPVKRDVVFAFGSHAKMVIPGKDIPPVAAAAR
jgi:hypothetical protein